ncbi:MAG: hypothetical protein ACM3ST_16555 [Bdellovibrio bacteriovorus]
MRMFEAESRVLDDLKDESEVLGERQGATFRVVAARHPTLGKLVIVTSPNGTGIVVETDE